MRASEMGDHHRRCLPLHELFRRGPRDASCLWARPRAGRARRRLPGVPGSALLRPAGPGPRHGQRHELRFGGTAACDWLPDMRRVAPTRPQAVVMEFSGNTFTSCMGGCPPESSSAVSKYCVDVSVAIHLFLTVGTHVFLDGTPISYAQSTSHDRPWKDLNSAFAALAAKYPRGVTYVDAGRAVEGPGGAFTWTLPCLPSEPSTGPTVAGVRTNVVRAPNGGHLCLVDNGNAPGCGSYSSGAFRFAAAMATPVIKAFHLSRDDGTPR